MPLATAVLPLGALGQSTVLLKREFVLAYCKSKAIVDYVCYNKYNIESATRKGRFSMTPICFNIESNKLPLYYHKRSIIKEPPD